MHHYKPHENVHSTYRSDVSGVGARQLIHKEGPVFSASAYLCERNIFRLAATTSTQAATSKLGEYTW